MRDARSPSQAAAHVAEQLEYFGMVGFDGSFISIQTGDRPAMRKHMEQLTQAMALMGEAAVAQWKAQASKAARSVRRDRR